MIIVNLATPKAAAKQELLFDKPATWLSAIKNLQSYYSNYSAFEYTKYWYLKIILLGNLH
jgi:hypothetical protein